jgi:hypothetical protein
VRGVDPLTVIVKVRGAIGANQLRQFYCEPCEAYFDAWSRRDPETNDFEKRTHSCGALCSYARVPKPGSRIAFRSSEVVPRDRRKVIQRYLSLNDEQIQHVTNEGIDRYFKEHGLVEVDSSWDDARNGGKRERGDLVDLPPDTDDPNVIREWNAKKYGRDAVQSDQERTRAAFDALQRGDAPPKLPEADEPNVHSTPHVIDVERTIEAVKSQPVVDAERRRELQGRIVA